MNFKKNLLVAAMGLSLPFAAGAVEVLDEDALDAVTGQDGISIEISMDMLVDAIVHDTDGFAGQLNDGAIVIEGMQVTTAAGNPVTVNIDAGDSVAAGAGTPALNIEVVISGSTVITTGTLSVANSQRDNAGAWGYEPGTAALILDNSTITLGDTTLNIQLGNEPQGHMVHLATAITGGLSVSNLGVSDSGAGHNGKITVGTLTVLDAGGTDLTLDVGIDVVDDAPSATVPAALMITTNQLGDATNGLNVRMERVSLGVGPLATVIGDVEMTLVQQGATTIYVSGH